MKNVRVVEVVSHLATYPLRFFSGQPEISGGGKYVNLKAHTHYLTNNFASRAREKSRGP